MKIIMKKFTIIVFCMLLVLTTVSAIGVVDEEVDNDLNIRGSVMYVFSGRDVPDWYMTNEEIEIVLEKMENLSSSEAIGIPEYAIHIINENNVSEFPYSKLYFSDNTIVAISLDGEINYYQDVNYLEGDVFIWGNEHDPNFIMPEPIPPNTPQIGVATGSMEGKVLVNSELETFIVIFSEGTATLEGKIFVPDFLTITKTSFSIDESEQFDVVVDTSEPKHLIGEILIESNDPITPEIKILVDFTIKGEKSPLGTILIILLVVLILAGLVAYIYHRRYYGY